MKGAREVRLLGKTGGQGRDNKCSFGDAVLSVEPRAFCVLGKRSTTEPHLQPYHSSSVNVSSWLT